MVCPPEGIKIALQPASTFARYPYALNPLVGLMASKRSLVTTPFKSKKPDCPAQGNPAVYSDPWLSVPVSQQVWLSLSSYCA